MKIIGIRRKLDNLGRITTPKEFRDHMSFEKKDVYEVALVSINNEPMMIIRNPRLANSLEIHTQIDGIHLKRGIKND